MSQAVLDRKSQISKIYENSENFLVDVIVLNIFIFLNITRIVFLIYIFSLYTNRTVNSHAGDMAVARQYGFKIDFEGNPISGSAAWFFVIIVKFLFTPIFEINIRNFMS